MSEQIQLTKVVKSGNTITYQHTATPMLSRYMNGEMYCQYSMNVEDIPDGIAVIPFLADVLPFIWLTDSTVEVEEVDKDFYECVDEVREGYKEMYPMLSWGGLLKTKRIIDFQKDHTHKKSAIQLFSGGVDANTTFFRHLDEKPDFVTVWGGGDVRIRDVDGWKKVQSHIQDVADAYGVHAFFVKSNFFDLLNIDNLNQLVKASGDQWWHGFQHSLAMLGLSAPISMEYEHLYIASTYPAYLKGQYTVASDPIIDDHVRFNGVRTIHDGYEMDRQDKVHYLVKKMKEGYPVQLRVCWESDGGSNCCRCEKCYRTILEIVSESGDPNEMGFTWNRDGIKRCKRDMLHRIRTSQNNILFLRCITPRMQEQKKNGVIGDEYDWFIDLDFDDFNDYPAKKIYNFPLFVFARRVIRKIKRELAGI